MLVRVLAIFKNFLFSSRLASFWWILFGMIGRDVVFIGNLWFFFFFFGRLDAEDWRKKKTVLEFRDRGRGDTREPWKFAAGEEGRVIMLWMSQEVMIWFCAFIHSFTGNDLVLHLDSFFYCFSHSFGQFFKEKEER